MIRVVLADDHPLLLRGLADLLSTAPDIDVLDTAGSGNRALWMVRTLTPDVAILDATMPELGGLDIARSVFEHRMATRVILLSATLSARQIAEAIDLDIWGLLLKECAPDMLLDSLRHVAGGGRWLPAELLAQARRGGADAGLSARLATLTPREREIAGLVCDGLPNRAVAARLAMSEGTVGVHLQNIYAKLDISNRTMLAAVHLRGQAHG